MTTIPQIETITRCPRCRKIIFNGEVLKARITSFKQGVAYAKCSVCKTWVKIPRIKIAD